MAIGTNVILCNWSTRWLASSLDFNFAALDVVLFVFHMHTGSVLVPF